MIIVLGKTKGELTMSKEKEEIELVDKETTQPEGDNYAAPQVEELAPHLNVKPDPVEQIKKLGKKTGIVVDCNMLRIREGANRQTNVLALIKLGQKVSVDLDNSTASFFEVTYKDKATDITHIGYCLKEYISLG